MSGRADHLLQWALRMQAAVRQVDLVDRHVDVAQRTFDGVHITHLAAVPVPD